MSDLPQWAESILADPVTKHSVRPGVFQRVDGIIDARVFLKNSYGYRSWADGQVAYEAFARSDAAQVEDYRAEIEYDRPVYGHFRMGGRILDCGGGAGTVRQFLNEDVEFVSTDPWVQAPHANSPERRAAYSCLSRKLTFIAATAEFQPFLANSFDWVHLRSMIDHVQVPDLVMLEAKRVLRPDGRMLIGSYVEGGRCGVITVRQRARHMIATGLSLAGIQRWKDHHVWHPTYKQLLKLVTDSGLKVEDTYWQPHWNDTVCYVCAVKRD